MTDHKKKEVKKPGGSKQETKKQNELSDTDLEKVAGGGGPQCPPALTGTCSSTNRPD
jgi:hypothetical protein